jgi:hypothetical protein
MKNFNIQELKNRLLEEVTEEKYQVIFHDYSGEDIPYTDEFFNSEMEAEKWAQSQEWDEQVEYFDGDDYKFKTQYRYYNPQENDSAFGYHIEKV